MDQRIDTFFQEWHQLGGAVFVAHVNPNLPTRSAEQVIAASTGYCRASGRLTWVVLAWLVQHIAEIDEENLLRETSNNGDLSVLGVLCDAAHLRNPNPKFERILRGCYAAKNLEPFFHRVAQSPLALAETRANALAVFRRWNYLCSELRYL